ncbi:GNAT family N-acetyltransferase [Klenkia marina]|uniref:GNAT family N-acetyltransferase n=1 Tax=Klenkia marina TaxID=1960309 RepID=UPI001FB54F7E|nr:GNAT family protein [Klenkia marina]
MLHPLRRSDAQAWSRLRQENEDWLTPWEPSAPVAWAARHTPTVYRGMRRATDRRARLGLTLPFAVRHRDRLVGQVTLDNVVRGALRSAHVGYWIDRAAAGQGIASLAVAMACDHAFGPVGLHRIQADVRPENARSCRLVERLGFREEGLFRSYLDIDGAWRDHKGYALLADDHPAGVVAHLRRSAQS